MNYEYVFLSYIYVLLAYGNSISSGWILKQSISTQHDIINIVSNQNQILIVQTNQSIYTATFDNPNTVVQSIVNSQQQNVPIAGSPCNSSVLYMSYRYINYQQANSSQLKVIEDIFDQTNLIKFQDSIFLYKNSYSPYLLKFNLSDNKIHQGPLLPNKYNFPSVMAISYELKFLFLSIANNVYVIDISTMRIRQAIKVDQQVISIILSQAGKFMILTQKLQSKITSLFRIDNQSNNYTLIFTSTNPESNANANGFQIFQEQDLCLFVSVDCFNRSQHLMNIVEFDCSQPYHYIDDKINTDGSSAIHALGENKLSVYSIIKEDKHFLLKHKIMSNHFELQQNSTLNLQITVPLDYYSIEKVSKSQILVLKPIQIENTFYLYSFKDKQCLCQKEISQKIDYSARKLSFFIFDLTQQLAYFNYYQSHNTLFWINLASCQINSKIYQQNVLDLWFLRGKMYILLGINQNTINEIDQNTLEVVDLGTRFDSTNNIILEDNFYGIISQFPYFKLVLYDLAFKINQSIQLPCNVNNIDTGKVYRHLLVSCNNFYHIYSKDLNYLESTSLKLSSYQLNSIENTLSASHRFAKLKGQLYQNIFKSWRNKLYDHVPELSPDETLSDLFFYNSTDGIFVSVKDKSIYLHYAVNQDLNFRIRRQTFLNLTTSESIISPTPLKWSCSKSMILFQFAELNDDTSTYINVYQTFTLRLLYSHRIHHQRPDRNIIGSHDFIADLGCDDLLYVSTHNGIQIVNLDKRRSILSQTIYDIKRLAYSSNGQLISAVGITNDNKTRLEIWNISTSHIQLEILDIKASSNSQIFVFPNLYYTYVLDRNKLYRHFEQIQDNIADCTYFDQITLLCLDLNNSFILLTQNKTTFQLELSHYSKIKITNTKREIVVYNQTTLTFIESNQNGFSVNQIISFQQPTISLLTISNDSNKILIYSKFKGNFISLQKGKCPPLSTLQNGRCQCKQSITDSGGSCICPVGKFIVGQNCQNCSFFCSSCSDSPGNCERLNAIGVIMIIGSAIFMLLFGILLYKCFQRWRGKKHQSSYQMTASASELTDQYSSIND